jgi:hypothetical protein
LQIRTKASNPPTDAIDYQGAAVVEVDRGANRSKFSTCEKFWPIEKRVNGLSLLAAWPGAGRGLRGVWPANGYDDCEGWQPAHFCYSKVLSVIFSPRRMASATRASWLNWGGVEYFQPLIKTVGVPTARILVDAENPESTSAKRDVFKESETHALNRAESAMFPARAIRVQPSAATES